MQLEVGKTYVTRAGRFRTITQKSIHPNYPYVGIDPNDVVFTRILYTAQGRRYLRSQDPRDLIKEVNTDMQYDYSQKTEVTMVKSDTVRKIDDGYNFIVINMANGASLGSHKTLEAAQLGARKALTQDSSFYIFQAVSKVSPKPIDADVEDLTI